jgi:hypothetical protein
VRQARSGHFDRSPECPHEPCNDRFAVQKRELLTEHGTDRKFKSVPHARHAQTGSRLEHYAEPRILNKMICNPQRIGAEIKDSSHSFNNQHELFVAGQCYSNAETRPIWFVSYLDLACLAADFNGPPITFVLNNFRSRCCMGFQEANKGIPVEWWTIGEIEGYTTLPSGHLPTRTKRSEF